MNSHTMSRNILLMGLLTVLLWFACATTPWAAIPKQGIQCTVCHESGGGGGSRPLKAEYQGNQGCVNCHSSSTSSTTYDLDVGMGETVTVPVVYYTGTDAFGTGAFTTYLAGGNFYWVAKGDDTKGHNVFADNPDDNHSIAPGDAGPAMGCGWETACHRNLNTTNDMSMPGLVGRQGCTKCHMLEDFSGPNWEGDRSWFSHHSNDSNLIVGSDVGDDDGYFRFLKGHQSGDGHGVCGIEDEDWQASAASDDHNEYLGYSGTKTSAGNLSALGHTMTGFCTGCHGNFHIEQQAGNWIRHPSDAVLPDQTPDSEYEAYTQYNPQVPVSRPWADLSGLSDPSSQVTAGVDMAMCLSCHRAHGSPYPHMLRWDTTDTAANGSCGTCHSRKEANASGQYHVSEVGDCNICHAHHGAGANYNYDPTGNIKLIQMFISTPNSGDKRVRFKRRTGYRSFADGDDTYDGVCEVCHTNTLYFENHSWNDPSSCDMHKNEYKEADCIQCHPHEEGLDPTLDEFLHGDQNPGQAAVCTQCHGHDDGYGGENYYGTAFSHSTHTEADSDDLRGPNIACEDCHDTAWYPCFADYEVKADTTACDDCHSPGGRFDGIDDADLGAKPNWAAGVYNEAGDALQEGKEAWCATCHDDDPTTDANESAVIEGVYGPGIAGVSQSDVTWYAPVGESGLQNLIDDNTGTCNTSMGTQAVFDLGADTLVTDIRIYVKNWPDGICWQVFVGDGAASWTRALGGAMPYVWKTGHLGEGWYQAKMDIFVRARYLKIVKLFGPCSPGTIFEVQYKKDSLSYGYFDTGHRIACSNCHDLSKAHIDGEPRTYAYSADNYQAGYRLKVANVVPRQIPADSTGVDPGDFALCFDCHEQEAFVNGDNMAATNFRDDSHAVNDHFLHLKYPQKPSGMGAVFDSDFDGSADSDMTCTACHNVHGSPTPGMVRHGELIDKIPALNLRYINSDGDPDGYLLRPYPDSDGAETYFFGSGSGGSVSRNGICNMCHNDRVQYTRVPLDLDAPTGFEVITLCPVDIRVIDPDGLIVDKVFNDIIGASYFEGDIDGDGSCDDRIFIPYRKVGEYTVVVMPESNPDPGDKKVYTLKAMTSHKTIIVAEDAPIGAPGFDDLYPVTSTQTDIGSSYVCLVTPEDAAILPNSPPPDFYWMSSGYDTFKVQFCSSPDFNSTTSLILPRSRGSELYETSLTPTARDWQRVSSMGRRNGLIYWRVKGKDVDGNIGLSETRGFTLENSQESWRTPRTRLR